MDNYHQTTLLLWQQYLFVEYSNKELNIFILLIILVSVETTPIIKYLCDRTIKVFI